jgi:hypothetical protein
MNKIKIRFNKLITFFAHFSLAIGFDPRMMLTLRHYFKYRSQYSKFKKAGGVITHNYPIFNDYDDQAGSASGHYFHQDLLVASFIFEKNPKRHIDIGSRIDGFVAHVASFRHIEVMDVRALVDTPHKNISFIKVDMINKDISQNNITDSISCLHAIEHFGLGRYGDQLDPMGHIKGFNNILSMLKPGGVIYISFPISHKNEIHFNAHRVFHPHDIFSWPNDSRSVALERFDFVDDLGKLHKNICLNTQNINVSFGCGIYTFKKIF